MNDVKVEQLLHEVIEKELETLIEMDPEDVGSDKYRAKVDCITKLTDRAIEIDKINIEAKAREESHEDDKKLKQKQMDDERLNRWITNGIAIAGIVIPSVITVWGTVKSIKFEETGTITTIMGRGFINKLLPRK